MTEKQKNAQNVEAENTKNEPEAPFQLIPPFKIDKKTKALAKTAGFDIGPIEAGLNRVNEWAQNVEARFKIAEQNFNAIDKGLTSLAPLIQYAEKMKQPQDIQPTTQEQNSPQSPVPPGWAQAIPLILQFMGQSQGGGNDMLTKMAMASLEADISLSKTLKNAVISSIATKATKGIVEGIPVGE